MSILRRRIRRSGDFSTAGRSFSLSRRRRSRRSRSAFGRYTGILVPWISETNYIIEPIRIGSSSYAFSLSTAQLVGMMMIALLTWMNTRGLKLGKIVQNIFTFAKTGSLIALIVLGIVVGLVWHGDIAAANFGDLWTVRGNLQDVGDGLDGRRRRSGCLSGSASHRPIRCFPPTRGTTSRSPPAR